MSCGVNCSVGCRQGSDLALLWLGCRLVATALIWPLAWEVPCATGVALKRSINQSINQTILAQIWSETSALRLAIWWFEPSTKIKSPILRRREMKKRGMSPNSRPAACILSGRIRFLNNMNNPHRLSLVKNPIRARCIIITFCWFAWNTQEDICWSAP